MDKKMVYRPDLAEDAEEFCPLCGAPVVMEEETLEQDNTPEQEVVPETIAALRELCVSRSVDAESRGFFLDSNREHHGGYGIYLDNDGDFVFYKNHSSGEKSIRYKGKDEAYAVRELYGRMKKDGCFPLTVKKNQPKENSSHGHHRSGSSGKHRRVQRKKRVVIAVALLLVLAVSAAAVYVWYANQPKDGYYHYHDDYYYLQKGSWYCYNSVMEKWEPVIPEAILMTNHKVYYRSIYYWEGSYITDFKDSGFYIVPGGREKPFSTRDFASSDNYL